MRVLEQYESWIHTHFVTDGEQLPVDRMREIESGLAGTLAQLGIVFGIHFEHALKDLGIRVVLECRPLGEDMRVIRRKLEGVLEPIPRRPPVTVTVVVDAQRQAG